MFLEFHKTHSKPYRINSIAILIGSLLVILLGSYWTIPGFSLSTQTVSLSTSSLMFAAPNAGSTITQQQVTLTNTGTGALSIAGIVASGNFAQTNTCGTSVAVGSSCTVSVVFNAVGTGTQTGSVTITDNAVGSLHVISLIGPVTNLASSAVATASSDTPVFGQTASKAIDGVISGYPTNTSAEWASNGQLVGAWIQLTWSSAVTVSQVVLYDRPNFSDNVQGGTLQFSDGSAVSVGGLSNDGQGNAVTFSPKTVTWVKFTVTQAVGINIGLAEFQVYGPVGPVGPAVGLSATSLTYGNQTTGTTSGAQVVTVTSNGSTAVTLSGVSTSGDYGETDTCGGSVGMTLGAGKTCTISVTFTPTVAGSRTGTLTIRNNGAGNPQTVSLAGIGVLAIPTIVTQPANQTVVAGQTATFSVVASGSLPLGYQWQKNGLDIAGANAVTYTTPPTTTTDNGSTFQVVVSNSLGTTTSGPATLFVNLTLNVLTYHYDNSRTGQNTSESVLQLNSVNSTKFGKLFAQPVDGALYAQPLYAANLTIPGKGVHNVVFVATENDSVYAFDSDSNSGGNSLPLWKASLVDAAHGAPAGSTPVLSTNIACGFANTPTGITSTPVIDMVSGTMYVVAYSQENGNYVYRLHALDIKSGNELSYGPTVIDATVPGTGTGSSGGKLTFSKLTQFIRPGLALSNGTIYLASAAHCEDAGTPYHGWLFAYDAATLSQKAAFVTTPNGTSGGIWMSGAGIAVDQNGDVFVSTGNGTFDTGHIPAQAFGDSIVKLAGGNLNLLDYFTPYNQGALDGPDLDVGAGGVLLLPDQQGTYTHELVQAGKGGSIYLINRDQMALQNLHYCITNCSNTDPQIVQELGNAVGGMWAMPSYWNNSVYFWGQNDRLKAYGISNGMLSASPTSSSTTSVADFGVTTSVSSNGTSNGIVWGITIQPTGPGAAVLHAYDASNVANELYNSNQAPNNRDVPGLRVKFAVPIVANGRVYIGTQTELDVYGLLP